MGDKRSTERNQKEFILNKRSPFIVQEAYKALRTNVTFSLTESSGGACIGVTSASRGEGKSTTTMNLAISYAQIGKRVMLIDCDMRLPTVAARLDICGTPGLSDVLVGEAKVESAIHSIDDYGIDVLPSGRIPPDATRLLSSKQMTAILDALRKHYDFIFVDLPPVTMVSDAVILANALDGYILLVRHEKSEYGSISYMIDQLRRAEANILGFVYNDAPTERKKYYGYTK
jgi:capsular exopolysaccharide synthesis family protein